MAISHQIQVIFSKGLDILNPVHNMILYVENPKEYIQTHSQILKLIRVQQNHWVEGEYVKTNCVSIF